MFGLFKTQKHEAMVNTAVMGEPVKVSEATVQDWLNAAVTPHDELFDQMDAVLQKFVRREPVRVWQMRRDLRWLRQQARELGLEWGTHA